ncbi:MAG: hypothetical protein QOD32_73 [Pyrinomonadaceae bacterium]|jgi:hypothetical protein|nr:hypothetical protein [Pyrinomonadaceae bacterium]
MHAISTRFNDRFLWSAPAILTGSITTLRFKPRITEGAEVSIIIIVVNSGTLAPPAHAFIYMTVDLTAVNYNHALFTIFGYAQHPEL